MSRTPLDHRSIAPHLEVIGHRGASGYLPENTREAFWFAYQRGARFIETDLVMTKDGHLVCRHENELSETTDIAQRPEFARRRTTRHVDGVLRDGWFCEDLTLAEVRTLRARERIPAVRPLNARFDGRYTVPTLAQLFALIARYEKTTGRAVGAVLELKHVAHAEAHGLDYLGAVHQALSRVKAWTGDGRIVLESFEPDALQDFASGPAPLYQLLPALPPIVHHGAGSPQAPLGRDQAAAARPAVADDAASLPADRGGAGDDDAATLTGAGGTPDGDGVGDGAGLAAYASYATGVSFALSQVMGYSPDATAHYSGAVEAAHGAGLQAWAYTARADDALLPAALRDSRLTPRAAVSRYLDDIAAAGLDGVFADQVDLMLAAVARRRSERGRRAG